MSSYTSFARFRFTKRLAVRVAAFAITAISFTGLNTVAQTAGPTEGSVAYQEAANLTVTSSTGPNLGPLSTTQTGATQVAAISGSKTASYLGSDKYQETVAFPAADYKTNYDVVLVNDATSSYASTAPQAQALLASLAATLATRTNTNIKVGAVGFSTSAYTSYAPGPGAGAGFIQIAAWSAFNSAIASGNWSTVLGLAGSAIPASYQAMLAPNVIHAVPDFTTGSFPSGPLGTGLPYMGTSAEAISAVDLLGGLQPLTTATLGTPATAGSISYTLGKNSSALAIHQLMAYGCVTAPSMVSTLGYTMANCAIGTNLEAGIKAGQVILDSDTATPAANKFLVIVTDAGTYYWDSSDAPGTSDPFTQLSGAGCSGTAINWAQASFDWNHSPYQSDGMLYGTFVGDNGTTLTGLTGATGTTVFTDPNNKISMADWQMYHTNCAGYLAASGITMTTTGWSNWAIYPYIAMERAGAHAAVAFRNSVNTNENVVLLGSPYNPQYPQPSALAARWMTWASGLTSSNGTAVQYFPIDNTSTTTTSASLTAAFNSIQDQLLYAFAKGTLTDTIGASFSLVQATAGVLNPADFTLTLAGNANLPAQTLVGTLNGTEIDYPSADGSVPNAYVLTMSGNTITLQVNVPIETENGLQLTYDVALNRSTITKFSWTTGVPLNDSASVNFTDSSGGTGTATFPVPVTDVYNPYVSPSEPPPQDCAPPPPHGHGNGCQESLPALGWPDIPLLAGCFAVLALWRRTKRRG